MNIQGWQEYTCNATKNMHIWYLQRSNSLKRLKAVNVTEKTDLRRNSSFTCDFKIEKYSFWKRECILENNLKWLTCNKWFNVLQICIFANASTWTVPLQ